jgi:hypothetical protein
VAVNTPLKEVATQDFFAPLRMTDIDINTISTENMPLAEAVPGKTGGPPPIVLTTATNQGQLQKQLKVVVKETLSSVTLEMGPELSLKPWPIFQQSKSTSKTTA